MRWIGLAVVAAACTGSPPSFPGDDMSDYFPFEEQLLCQWQFLNEDPGSLYRLTGEIENSEAVEDHRRYTVVYRKDCFNEDVACADGDMVRSLTWSYQGNQGINLHEVRTPDATLTLEPSIRFAERYMKRGDVATSETNGTTYTATYDIGACDVRIDEWEECGLITLASAAGTDLATGSYWLINDFSVVAMTWEDEGTRWELGTHITLEED